MSEFEHNGQLFDLISDRLHQFNRIEQSNESLTRAAVVLGVSNHANSACLLLTKRSSKLRKHAGQYALPGGKVDPDETIIEAALRELSEELNLTPDATNVMGVLDDMPTHSGFCITPVVVWIDNHNDMHPNPDEVADVYEIPLQELEAVDLGLSYEDENSIAPGAAADTTDKNRLSSRMDDSVMSIYLPSVGTSIYSPTAAIIYQFREVILRARHTRVAHFGQPKFAWK